jgi:tetratricopeptide (TPR) repeat protein
MRRGIGIALVFLGCMAAYGLQQNSGVAPGQTGQSAQQPNKPVDSNPFPTDTSDVPVMPSNDTPNTPTSQPSHFPTASVDQIEDTHYAVPGDSDPVASPDDANGGAISDGQVSSSNTSSLDSILPQPGDDEPTKKGKRRSNVLEGKPVETAAQDISVAKYYLDNKNWRAALSRFQSALVLAPEDPEVYWGLAVSQQHTGDYANARANYEKVIEYDPDSKHAKEAKKALNEPELANAKPAPKASQP